jgi:EAL domain-containing protein (putative c-di-GMP-specific phosphodiesterase class I)
VLSSQQPWRAGSTEIKSDTLTLHPSGDAVISIDTQGLVTYLNVVAERLTGWTIGEAIGRPREEVLRISDAQSRAAPIHDRRGQLTGAVMMFHDVSTARRSDLNAHATERESLETGMRRAIQRHDFELRYQPIMNLATGAIAGVESLIRWRHPALGFVLPAQLISTAEESGLILPIGQWVLREACIQAKAWHNAGLPLLRLSINTSAIEMRSKEFVAGVAKILSDTGFDAKRLELEFTEAFLVQDSKSTALVLRELKELGVQLALDDFGTGHSSVGNMRRFPIDALKVHQSIVRDLATDAGAAAVVSGVINMGSSLHLRVVAEGVETRDQLWFLEQHECTEAQGFYFSPPLAAEGFADLLQRRRSQHNASALQG